MSAKKYTINWPQNGGRERKKTKKDEKNGLKLLWNRNACFQHFANKSREKTVTCYATNQIESSQMYSLLAMIFINIWCLLLSLLFRARYYECENIMIGVKNWKGFSLTSKIKLPYWPFSDMKKSGFFCLLVRYHFRHRLDSILACHLYESLTHLP